MKHCLVVNELLSSVSFVSLSQEPRDTYQRIQANKATSSDEHGESYFWIGFTRNLQMTVKTGQFWNGFHWIGWWDCKKTLYNQAYSF